MGTLFNVAVVVEALILLCDWALRIRHELLEGQILVTAFDPIDAITDGVKQRAFARWPWRSVVWL